MITPPKLQSVPSVHLRDIIPLHLGNLAQSSESRAHGGGGGRGDGVGTSAVQSAVSFGSSLGEVVWNKNPLPSRSFDLRNSALAGLAVPDADGVTLDAGLAAEGADVLGVLGDLHLLDRLTQRGTVSLQLSVSFFTAQDSGSRRSRNTGPTIPREASSKPATH